MMMVARCDLPYAYSVVHTKKVSLRSQDVCQLLDSKAQDVTALASESGCPSQWPFGLLL